MDPHLNPYTPGPGFRPVHLAGRDRLCEHIDTALQQARQHRPTLNPLIVGLRGSGKTVLLRRALLQAEAAGLPCAGVHAAPDRSLPSLLAPAIRALLIRIARGDGDAGASAATQHAQAMLAGFVRSSETRFGDVAISVPIDTVAMIPASGELSLDLAELFAALANVGRELDSAILIAVDELQLLPAGQLLALLQALEQCVQQQHPILLLATGLPSVLTRSTQLSRLSAQVFDIHRLVALDNRAAAQALIAPAASQGVKFEASALDELLRQGAGCPYFLQELGRQVWAAASSSPIRLDAARLAVRNATAELDAGFFRRGFDVLSPLEKLYLRAMAELGADPHRSGDIARAMQRPVTTLAPTRNGLIAKGLIYSPLHGDTAFTTPQYDAFLRRMLARY